MRYVSEETTADLQTKHRDKSNRRNEKNPNQTTNQKIFKLHSKMLAICKLFPNMLANSGNLPMLKESVAGVIFSLSHACQVQSY